MTTRDACEARTMLDSRDGAITFRRKGGGYYYPDRIIDRNAIRLVGVQYNPSTEPDEVINQFADKAWVTIID